MARLAVNLLGRRVRYGVAIAVGGLLVSTAVPSDAWAAGPSTECGGSAPETMTCEASFETDSADVRSGVSLAGDLVGLLRATISSDTGRIEWLCGLALSHTCSADQSGVFIAGQQVIVRGEMLGTRTVGSGRWSVMAWSG